jgi:hypothetical protein
MENFQYEETYGPVHAGINERQKIRHVALDTIDGVPKKPEEFYEVSCTLKVV